DMASTSRRQSRARAGSGSGRGASWLRNNWTEAETREVMEILVEEFISNDYATAAYSKSHAPDERFKDVSFSRPPRELYNKVQNLRQRFFTPHSYLLRWAGAQADVRAHRRAEKCLMNPKTRDSIHGIFAGAVPEALRQLAGRGDAGDAGEGVSVKSVNYYCDIFRRRAGDTWRASVEAYTLFLANRALQSAVAVPASSPDAASDGEAQRGRRAGGSLGAAGFGSPPQSLGSSAAATELGSAHATPSSAAMTEFGSDMEDGEPQQLVAAVGRSWHRFLALRSRWQSLGLQYAGRDDWQQQELAALAQHALTLADYSIDAQADLALSVVPLFAGTFDAANIEMAVNRAQHVRTARLATLAADVAACLQFVDGREQFAMLSLCWLVDRATRTRPALALLVSYGGGGGQRFGLFPHNDAMLARLVAGSESLWYRYRELPAAAPRMPPTPEHSHDAGAASVAFAYAQNGFKYAFFSRRKGHFFEMTRDEDWAPTMVAAQPRSVWAPDRMARDALLELLRQDHEKLLAAMVELFGLRLFCHGFFDAVAGGPGSAHARRISDDSALGARRRRNPSTSARLHRNRISTGALPSLSGNAS
ncbi:hypothetical protein IWW54_005586, partial [Coemansia sp. RSA 2705]